MRGCVLLALVVTLAACEEGVDPIIGAEYPFTVWGFMNAGADTQYVRVYEISDELRRDVGPSIDAMVYSTDLTTGERREWTYENVRFDSVSTGHVFWSPFRAEHSHRYRLDVVRSDGAASAADVMVPSPVEFEVGVRDNAVVVPVEITGDAPNLVGARVTYTAINIPPAAAWPPGTPVYPPVLHPVTIDYDQRVERTDDGWQFLINLVTDTAAVWSEFRRNCLITPPAGSAPNIWLRNVELSFVVADSAWSPPGGVFDPDILAVPGTMSNIENGYGFFGAGLGVRYSWTPSIDARRQAGYSLEARCLPAAGGPRPVPECMNPPIPCEGEYAQDIWRLFLR